MGSPPKTSGEETIRRLPQRKAAKFLATVCRNDLHSTSSWIFPERYTISAPSLDQCDALCLHAPRFVLKILCPAGSRGKEIQPTASQEVHRQRRTDAAPPCRFSVCATASLISFPVPSDGFGRHFRNGRRLIHRKQFSHNDLPQQNIPPQVASYQESVFPTAFSRSARTRASEDPSAGLRLLNTRLASGLKSCDSN